jgi:hypothetical protein
MPQSRRVGRSIPLSLPRRFVIDLAHFARAVPSVPVRRQMVLADVAGARLASPRRMSWAAVFLKAFSLVAARRPELRRCYLSWPRPRLYEHPENVAAISVERKFEGEDAVLIALRPHPERASLIALDAWVRSLKMAPIGDVPSFRRLLRITRLPWPVRRLAWWAASNAHGIWHAKNLGTFGLSTVAAAGATLPNLLSPLATTLNYGPVDPDGACEVTLTFDHRVLDGAPAARALADLEAALAGPVRDELLALAPRTGQRPAA